MTVDIAGHRFHAVLENKRSPETCASFERAMPFSGKVVHVRWSGEAMWIPLGDRDSKVGYEDAT